MHHLWHRWQKRHNYDRFTIAAQILYKEDIYSNVLVSDPEQVLLFKCWVYVRITPDSIMSRLTQGRNVPLLVHVCRPWIKKTQHYFILHSTQWRSDCLSVQCLYGSDNMELTVCSQGLQSGSRSHRASSVWSAPMSTSSARPAASRSPPSHGGWMASCCRVSPTTLIIKHCKNPGSYQESLL